MRPAPEGCDGADWEQVTPSLQSALCKAISERSWPIAMFGDVGCGKSMAAASLFCKWQGFALWWPAGMLMALIAEGRGNGKGFVEITVEGRPVEMWHRAMIRDIAECDLLVIDDIGIRPPTPAQSQALFDVLQARKGKPFIITANKGPGTRNKPGLEEILEDRHVSRLSAGQWLEVTGDDRRLVRQIRRVG